MKKCVISLNPPRLILAVKVTFLIINVTDTFKLLKETFFLDFVDIWLININISRGCQ